MMTLPVAASYRDAVRVSLVLQVAITLLLLSLLDGGTLAKIGAAAMCGFLIGVAIVMIRRPRNPRPLDLLYVRWGYIAMLIISIALSPLMGVLRR